MTTMKGMMIGAFTMMLAGTAFALTLKERKQLEDWNKELDPATSGSQGQLVKTKCGVDIPATLDPSMVTPFMEENTNAASYCDAAREAIVYLCGDATSKKAVVSQVAKVSCKLGPKGSVSFKLKGKTLEMTVGVGAVNLFDKAKDFLENHLK